MEIQNKIIIIPELISCMGDKIIITKEMIKKTEIFTDHYKKGIKRHLEEWRKAFLGKLAEYATEVYFNNKFHNFFSPTKFDHELLYGDGGIDKICLKYSLSFDDKALLTRIKPDRKDQVVYFPDREKRGIKQELKADIYQVTEINVSLNEDCSIKTNDDGSIHCKYLGYLTKYEVEWFCEDSAYERFMKVEKMEALMKQKQIGNSSV